ncbi:MDR family oxidoreductase [Aeromicrobium sp. UC242_57]|uniref:MDR family oxidoreductase n=1 Tax=Aeromicrobium sp. UC242_57 TaxID=3374624 RepID=UPI0037A674A2
MIPASFSRLRPLGEGGSRPAGVELTPADLPDGDVVVEVDYSSLNYKDGLAVSGQGRIARSLPMTCGIDLAGRVVESSSADWSEGDEVIATGWGLSETEQGGYTRYQRVRSQWLVRKPSAFSALESMAIGTAGLTAMLCVLRLQAHGLRDGAKIVVTGASGGVGSVAVALLARAGYEVEASTGSAASHELLTSLGASSIIDRAELSEPGRPLGKERWDAGVDTVGSHTLANVLSQISYGGAVAACGLAGGADLPSTVMPFILRGVDLLGVDSVYAPIERRVEPWDRLAADLPSDVLAQMTTVRAFDDLPRLADDILAGATQARVVIDVAGA